MTKIFTIVGARPNFIKVDTELKQYLIHTGQHYDYRMSNLFFKELRLPNPHINLGCKGDAIGRMIDKLGFLYKRERPNLVIVFGDTASSLAGAVAASYKNIPVAHIESGLRSFRIDMPEEINRVLIDRIARIRFCPNSYAVINLLKEGISKDVYVVGDPSFDTLGQFLPIPKTKNNRQYLLLTVHRNFNTDSKEALTTIFDAVRESQEKTIFPIHPRTKKVIKKLRIMIPKNIHVVEPVSYKNILSLTANAKKVLTDSGGIQREAAWMNIPVIILRPETEWVDIVSNGNGILVGCDKVKILNAVANFKGRMNPPPVFGAKKKIREILYKYL